MADAGRPEIADEVPVPRSVDDVADGEDRVLTIPNVITVIRLCTLPVFVWLLFGAENRHAAGWVLFLIGSTDWVDGYLARRLGQVSNLGKILDPVADRLLFFVGVGSIIIDGAVPIWFAVAVLIREAIIAAATLGLAAAGAKRIDVTWFGKAATFLLMGAFPSFLVGASDASYAGGMEALAWGVGIPGLVLSYYSAVLYVPLGRKALAEGRQGRLGNRDSAEPPA